MNILLISQCSKQALPETRRVLDQFAERKGDRVWQTPITLEGLTTLRKLLKKTARRNTAVACHWIRGKNQTVLLWIVGSIRKFNLDGTVPTNTTRSNILRTHNEQNWDSSYSFALLAGLAGLFHDFGKANDLFQQKICDNTIRLEPHRHEWLSLLLFKAFVDDKQDKDWLSQLACGEYDFSNISSQIDFKATHGFFERMSPVAQSVAWLILTHHRLPSYSRFNCDQSSIPPALTDLDNWLTNLNWSWNSGNMQRSWEKQNLTKNCSFSNGIPSGTTWEQKAKKLASRALRTPAFFEQATLHKPFPLHLARLCLMLSDHCYSASDATEEWQDLNVKLVANTDRRTGKTKQKLDEHLVGVGHNAFAIARRIPALRQFLPAIARHSLFKKRNKNMKFKWQDKAYDLACNVRHATDDKGFFGVNMASTGCGKTFANARIMYGLSDRQKGCRFSVALGLRTLTLQTGDALRKRLKLNSEDIAVTIGSQRIEKLHSKMREYEPQDGTSESADDFAEHLYVSYEGAMDNGFLSRWLKQTPKLHKLVSAPISISTIDHLILATEGLRGGRQIAPMLRLLTSDLILDEPDDFGVEDLPALCRLVHWAGMLGSRVLLASATLPPVLVEALFEAYQQGRRDFTGSISDRKIETVCAWFDEFGSQTAEVAGRSNFTEQHRQFVEKRVKNLAKEQTPVRKARIHHITETCSSKSEAISIMAKAVREEIHALHDAHCLRTSNGKNVSLGVVRMANIKPMVAVAAKLLETSPAEDFRCHFCVYHSQQPLAVRSHIEHRLDQTLQRSTNSLESFLEQEEIEYALRKYPEKNQVFIVLATSIVEVGRDHDYDWAIAEPSSMRSLIQLAGRVQRHRGIEPEQENIVIFNKNIKALLNKKPAYCKPGFESKDLKLSVSDLSLMLEESSYKHISATPRITAPDLKDSQNEFVSIEHKSLIRALFTAENKNASPWWKNSQAHLFGEMQVQQPFRNSRQTIDYFLFVNEDGEQTFKCYDENASVYVEDSRITLWNGLSIAERNQSWLQLDNHKIYSNIASMFSESLNTVSAVYGVASLHHKDGERYLYHPLLGIFSGTYLDND